MKQISNLFGILKLAPPVRLMIHSRMHCNAPVIITSLWSENKYTIAIDFRIYQIGSDYLCMLKSDYLSMLKSGYLITCLYWN